MSGIFEMELFEETKGRASVYQMLSRAFGRPDQYSGQLAAAIAQVIEALGLEFEVPKDTVEVRTLEIEYNRLFVGPGHVHCPPYESVYRSDRPQIELGLVMGPSTLDVGRLYREAGFAMSKALRDLPDHISVELEFMHLLCEKSLQPREDAELWRKRQGEFIMQHLRPWVGTFADSVVMNTSSPFYGSTAGLLKEFMLTEIRSFEG